MVPLLIKASASMRASAQFYWLTTDEIQIKSYSSHSLQFSRLCKFWDCVKQKLPEALLTFQTLHFYHQHSQSVYAIYVINSLVAIAHIHTEIQVLYRMMAAVPPKNDIDIMLNRCRCRCPYGARLEMDPAGGGRPGD